MDGFFQDVVEVEVECRAGEAVGHGLREITIVPDGRVQSKNGTMIMDREGAELVIKEFEQHATPLPIDVDHQTLGGKYAAPSGRAPAAGWIERLFYEPGRGLVGVVNWTDEGRDLVRSQKYRFLSPVAIIRKADRRVVGLHSAALTNKPAIPAMERVAAAEDPEGDEGATESVTPDQWLERIVELLRKRGYDVAEKPTTPKRPSRGSWTYRARRSRRCCGIGGRARTATSTWSGFTTGSN